MIAECGGVVGYGMDGGPCPFQLVWYGLGQCISLQLTVQENPGMGTQWKGCFRNDTSCGCYPLTVVLSMLPVRSWRTDPSVSGVRDLLLEVEWAQLELSLWRVKHGRIKICYYEKRSPARVEENLEKGKFGPIAKLQLPQTYPDVLLDIRSAVTVELEDLALADQALLNVLLLR